VRRGKKDYPATQRLQQISGVGPLTALCFVLKIGDPQSTTQFELVEQMLAARKQIRPARGGQRISGDKSGSKGTW